MIKERLRKLKESLKKFNIDGYIIPKNDEYFSEYSVNDRLKSISNFSGSAGYALVLKNRNYLFVDGRYTIQAHIESGKNFKIVALEKILNCSLFKNLTIGLDPKLFTSTKLKKFFFKYNKIKIIDVNLIDQIIKRKIVNSKPFYSLQDDVVGETYKIKIEKLFAILKKSNCKFTFISAPENVAWLLNIRGKDNPNSPIPNCHIFLDDKKNIYFLGEKVKFKKILKEKKIKNFKVINVRDFKKLIQKFKNKKILIDIKSCSLFYEKIIRSKFKIVKKEDPIYLLKSIKNKVEIQNFIKTHIIDGVALTKFIYWIKKINKKKITEFEAQNKLESFRRLNKKYLFPSFNTIAGSGENGAIVHYRATRKKTKLIKKDDIFLCDSGGQYKYGTTDVTRTISFSKVKKNVREIYTKVLKGHIAVANSDLSKYYNGKLIDIRARKYLKESNLDYAHGTGHGVGYFLNVHEGPQAISKYNEVKICEGMVLSNEPGYYKKGKFGIRIENLIYVKKVDKKIFFENLTLTPLEKDLINYKKLNQDERDYLLKYNLSIYSKLSKYLNQEEKKWLLSLV